MLLIHKTLKNQRESAYRDYYVSSEKVDVEEWLMNAVTAM